MMALDSWAFAQILLKFGLYLGALLCIGSVIFQRLHREAATGLRVPLMLQLWSGWGMVLLISLLAPFITVGSLLDAGLQGMFDGELLGIVLLGPLGRALLVKLIGLGFIAFAFLCGPSWLGLIGALLVATSFSLVGHARSGGVMTMVLISAHVFVLSYWIAALFPLYQSVLKDSAENAALLCQQFGKNATFAVGILIVTGAVSAFLLIGPPTVWMDSPYGSALLLKVILVAGLLGLAAMNKLRHVPRLVEAPHRAQPALLLSIAREMGLVLLILLVTASLTSVMMLPE